MEAHRIVEIAPQHMDAVQDLQIRSFGRLQLPEQMWRRRRERIADGRRALGLFIGDTLAAAAHVSDFRQWWCGRRTALAGVGGVVVAPQFRGAGAATEIVRALMRRAHEFGYPLAALYPSSLPLYRKFGFEIAGAYYRSTFPAAALRGLADRASRTALIPGGAGDVATIHDIAAKVYARDRDCGPVQLPEEEVADLLRRDGVMCYLAEDGFVIYRWDEDDALVVEALIAGSESTSRTLWDLVGSGSSIARHVHAVTSPVDPIHLLSHTRAEAAVHVDRWMLRIVDAPGAVAARGWPPSVTLDLHVVLEDAEFPENAGAWHLGVAEGAGLLRRLGGADRDVPDAVRMGPRGFAALYAGTPMATLRRSGLITGGDADRDVIIDFAFAGSPAYMLHSF